MVGKERFRQAELGAQMMDKGQILRMPELQMPAGEA